MQIECGKCGKVTEGEEVSYLVRYKCANCKSVNELVDISIQEWLGFNYGDYLKTIIQVVESDPFNDLKAENALQLAQGYLTTEQINALRTALIDTFREGKSVRYLAEQIKDKVKLPELDISDDDESYTIPADIRAIMVARTESTRMANIGAEKYYKDNDVEEYSWLASTNACDDCAAMNGTIYKIGNGELPPLHVNCRCSIIAVTGLNK